MGIAQKRLHGVGQGRRISCDSCIILRLSVFIIPSLIASYLSKGHGRSSTERVNKPMKVGKKSYRVLTSCLSGYIKLAAEENRLWA